MSETCNDEGGVDFWCQLPKGHEGQHLTEGGPAWTNLDPEDVRDLVSAALPDVDDEDLADALDFLHGDTA